jgi:hypothetical protein
MTRPSLTKDTLLDELSRLALQHGSDKVHHGFTAFYDRVLEPVRAQVKTLVEIGVLEGASLCMWRDYLPNAQIHGMDITPLRLDAGERVRLYQGDQTNRADLAGLAFQFGEQADVIVDDGGHTMGQQQTTLAALFPSVRPGGIFIMEDLHTSFIDEIGWLKNGEVMESYRTGVGEGILTTFDYLAGLAKQQPPKSPFMSDANAETLIHDVERIEFFDRDGDRQHMTAIVYKKS